MIFNKKGIILALTIFILLVGVIGCSSKNVDETDKNVIKIGTSGGYHPYTFKNDKGELDGFEIDVWNEISSRIGYEVEYVTSEFSGLFGMIDIKKIDTIANQITITDQRKEKYIFPTPYVYSGAQLIVKKGNEDVKSLENLKGKKVGVSLGSNYEQIIREFDVNNEIEVITYEDFLGSLQDVALGRIDAVLNDKLAAMINVQKSGLDIQLGGKPISKIENAFPFVDSEENRELVDKVSKAIEDMTNDESLEKISKKWFEIDITKE